MYATQLDELPFSAASRTCLPVFPGMACPLAAMLLQRLTVASLRAVMVETMPIVFAPSGSKAALIGRALSWADGTEKLRALTEHALRKFSLAETRAFCSAHGIPVARTKVRMCEAVLAAVEHGVARDAAASAAAPTGILVARPAEPLQAKLKRRWARAAAKFLRRVAASRAIRVAIQAFLARPDARKRPLADIRAFVESQCGLSEKDVHAKVYLNQRLLRFVAKPARRRRRRGRQLQVFMDVAAGNPLQEHREMVAMMYEDQLAQVLLR